MASADGGKPDACNPICSPILTPKLLQEVANEISSKHMRRLAVGYLNFTLPEVERIERDSSTSSDAIFQILSQWSNKNPNGRGLLCEKLQETGRKEGLVSISAVNLLSGKESIYNAAAHSRSRIQVSIKWICVG